MSKPFECGGRVLFLLSGLLFFTSIAAAQASPPVPCVGQAFGANINTVYGVAPFNGVTVYSNCSLYYDPVIISAATNANPVVFTALNHGLGAKGIQRIQIYCPGYSTYPCAMGSWASLAGQTYPVTVIDANTFSIPIDATGFGTLAGYLAGDYSNPIGTGLEWQCVEFVRRYYLQIYHAPTSQSNLGEASSWYGNYSQLSLLPFQNGKSATPPQVGDILASQGPSRSNGHVAIVSSVSSDRVCAVMQDWSNDLGDADGSHCMAMTSAPYTVSAFDSPSGLAEYPIQGWLRNSSSPSEPPLPAPIIDSGGNPFNAANEGYLSPGALATVFGSNFASGTAATSATAPYPTSLGGASVLVSGRAAPLIYVDQEQINFQVPWETSVGNATVTVVVNAANSNTATVPVVAADPGLFFTEGNPLNYPLSQPAIQNSDYTLNTSSNPARAGTSVVAYLTGTGPVNPPVSDGTISPSDPLSFLTSQYSAILWPGPAVVSFAGLTPGLVGLTQMNIEVPAGLATGTYPMSITVNGQVDNTANVSVVANSTSTPTCATYPAGFVPFSNTGPLDLVPPLTPYISKPDSGGDRLLVGNMSLNYGGNFLFYGSFAEFNGLPLPAFENQQFCGTVTLATGESVVAYVPTAAERGGNFSAFAGLLIDPLANEPFPGGIIPANRLPYPVAWRIAPVGAPVPQQ